MELFFLRKIHRICPQHRGPDPPPQAHGSTDFIKRRSLVSGSTAQIESSESVPLLGCLDPIGRWVGIGSSQPMQESPGANPMAEVANSGREHVYAILNQFSMRFAHTGSQRRRKRVYVNLNQRRATTKPGNGEEARPVLVDGEGSLR
jgi:hypothetical protein